MDYTHRGVMRTCAILDLLAATDDGATLSEIGQAVGLNTSTTWRYLWTLQRQRYVEHDMHHRYHIGPAVTALISIRMPRDLVDRLDERAAAIGTTRSDLIRAGAEAILQQ